MTLQIIQDRVFVKSRYTKSFALLFVIYLILNIYVSFMQTKILLVGDIPHEIFKPYYGALSIAFAWSPSLSLIELDKTLSNNKFDIVIIGVSPSVILSSKKNRDIISTLSKNSKIYWIADNVSEAQVVKNDYDLHLNIVDRTTGSANSIINGEI